MNRELRKAVKEEVKERGEDLIENLNDFYGDLEIGGDEGLCVEVNNLFMKLMIKEVKGYEIIGD